TEENSSLRPRGVAAPPAGEREAAEGQGVRVDDPLEIGLAEPKVLLDRRERDVDDRRAQDDHELRHADENEDQPRIDVEPPASGTFDRDVGHDKPTLAI